MCFSGPSLLTIPPVSCIIGTAEGNCRLRVAACGGNHPWDAVPVPWFFGILMRWREEYGALFWVRPDCFTISVGGGKAMAFEYGEGVDMNAFAQGERLRVAYYADSRHTEAVAVSRA